MQYNLNNFINTYQEIHGNPFLNIYEDIYKITDWKFKLFYQSAPKHVYICCNALWKYYAIWKVILKCVKCGTESTNCEFFFFIVRLTLDQVNAFCIFFSKGVKKYINFFFKSRHVTLFEKHMYKSISDLLKVSGFVDASEYP